MYYGKNQNSEYISGRSVQNAILQASLGTGPGEAGLETASQFHQEVVLRESPAPTRYYNPEGTMATKPYYVQPQFNYGQSSRALVTNRNTHTENVTVKDGSETRNRLIQEFFLVVCGMVICGIPLAVVSTLYGQLRASSTTTTTATVTSSVSLPSQCFNYTLDTDATRLVSYAVVATACDVTLYSTPIWVRFGGTATLMTTSAPPIRRCAASATGWYTGTLPSTAGLTVSGVVCFSWTASICDFHSTITVTNCSGFYAYLMVSPSQCSLRYCTE